MREEIVKCDACGGAFSTPPVPVGFRIGSDNGTWDECCTPCYVEFRKMVDKFSSGRKTTMTLPPEIKHGKITAPVIVEGKPCSECGAVVGREPHDDDICHKDGHTGGGLKTECIRCYEERGKRSEDK